MVHHVETLGLGTPSLGTERALTVHRFGHGGARPKAYLHAALHAAELPGIVVLEHLLARLEAADADGRIKGEIVVVPFANPIGLAQQIMMESQGRYDLATGRNYNRGFPNLTDAVAGRIAGKLGDDADANVALIRQAMGDALDDLAVAREPEVLKRELLKLSYDADIVLDLHSAWEALLHLFVTDVNWPLAEDLTRQMRAEVVLVDRGNAMMTFKSAHALVWKALAERFPEAPIPPGAMAAVVELRGQRDVDDYLTRPDADNLYRFLQRRGVVEGDPGPLPEALTEPRAIRGLKRLMAPAGGIVVYHRELGDHVMAGEAFCHVVDPQTRHRTAVIAPHSGLLYARRSHRFARAGQYICAIASDTPL